MAGITLSKAVRSNLLNLQSTANLLSKSQERLSSGLRVNSALDNPTNFFTAQGLNSRANDLSQLSDAVSNAVQTVAAADKGISAITKLVESAQATARQALQTAATVSSTGSATATGTTSIASDTTATLTGTAGGYNAGTASSYGAFGDASALTLDIGGTQVTFQFYNTTGGATGHTSYSGPDIGIDTDDGGTQKTIGDLLSDIQAGLRASGVAGTADATVGLSGGFIQFTLGTDTTHTLSVVSDTTGDAGGGVNVPYYGATGFGLADGASADPGNTTLGALSGTLTVGSNTLTFGSGVGEINSRGELTTALAGLGGGITGSIDGSDHLSFTSSGSFTVGGTLAGATFGIAAQTYSGSTTQTANPKRAELVETYNDLLGQIDALAKDSSFNGVNLLNGDNLSVLFNEDGSSKINITGVTDTSTGLGLSQLTLGTEFDTNSGVNDVLDDLKGVIDTLRSQSAKFGSNLSVVETRQDFTKSMINVLQTGAANLTLADSNEEAANVLALQTRQQLSSTALSLASQSDQNVLRLF